MGWCLDTSQPGCPEVWEDSDDEEISCEKEHQSQGVSAVAREILQGGGAVVEVGVGGGTPDGIDWKKNMYERRRRLQNEDRLPQVRKGGSNTKWTLAQAFELCAMCFFRGKNGAIPYPADSKEQITWWEEQERHRIGPRMRTIRMNIAGCPPGTKKHSPKLKVMQNSGKTPEDSKKRKRERSVKISQGMMGQDQKNAVEGVAIHLLICFLRSVIKDFDLEWELMPVFDGLEADFAIRKKDWELDVWVPMQMKSASECIEGKGVNYGLRKSDYPNVYCVCVGMQGYVHRTDDVTDPDDIANAPGCVIAEIWDIGSCSNIETSMRPTFGTPYSKLPPGCRLHFPSATDKAKFVFAETFLRNIEAWPRMERRRIFYEFSHDINSEVKANHQTEKFGFLAVDAALRAHGLCVDPVWRQGEGTDHAVAGVETGKHLVFVSAKTATVTDNKNPKKRQFKLRGAPNKHLCDVVVASYSGTHHKVAVMSRDTVYVEGMKSFSWNEKCLKPGVRIFDDIRNEQVGKAFVDYILSFRRV